MATRVAKLNDADAPWRAVDFDVVVRDLLTEGVLNNRGTNDDLKVIQRAAGANMSVDVNPGMAFIQVTIAGDTWKVKVENTATVNVPIASNASGSNRVDAIIFRVDVDANPNVTSSNVGTIERVAGTGAVALTNGAIQALIGSDSFMRLADVTVANGAVSIVTANIADTRAVVSIGRNAGGYQTKFVGDGSLLVNVPFNAQDAHKVILAEEASSGIVAGNAVYQQADGEASKNATIKTFIGKNKINFVDANATYAINYMVVSWVSEYKFFGAYNQQNGASSNYYVAFVGYLDKYGNVVEYAEKTISSGTPSASTLAITALNDNAFILTENSTSSSNLACYLVTMDADGLMTVDSNRSVSTEFNYYAICRLSDTSCMLLTRNAASDDVEVRTGTYSGTVLTWNSSAIVDSGICDNFHALRLTDTKAVAIWGVTGSMSARIINMSSGNTVATPGTGSYSFTSATVRAFAARMSDTAFGIVMNDTTASSGNVKVISATVSGDTITFGSPLNIGTYSSTSSNGAAGACGFTSNSFLVTWSEYGPGGSFMTSNYYMARITVASNVCTKANQIQVGNNFAPFDVQLNYGNENTITNVNGNIIIPMRSYKSTGVGSVVIKVFRPIFNERFIGIAAAAPASGFVSVLTQGDSGALLSGLTVGKSYFANMDGTIARTGMLEIGPAIATTKVLIRPSYD